MNQQDEILNEARSFLRSRVILSAAELDLFTRLHENQLSVTELSTALQLDSRAMTRLLDCLVTFDLLEKQNGQYRTTDKGAILSSHHPENILPMVLHLNHLWDNWSHLTATVKQGVNPDRKPVTKSDDGSLEAFIGAMHVIGRNLAGEIAAAYDLSPYKSFLDVGGASGTYTIAFLRESPKLTATIFDLEKVIPLAEEKLKGEGLRERVTLVPGDFYKDELPHGSDLALLSAIIHQNSPAQNVELFQKLYRALVPGGVLLIRDHIMDESRTKPPAGALFALNMLAVTEGGDTYTFEEVKGALQQAGFNNVKLVRRGEKMDCLVEARKYKEGSSQIESNAVANMPT